ncbi:MAG: ribonuclease HII [Patescibacteria group bacterium]
MMIPMRCMLGVDEAGRGPLAGPVAVGVAAVAEGFDVMREFPGVADSKKLSEKKREKIFEMLETRVSAGDARFAVEFESAETIDEEGIVAAVRRVNALADEIGHPMSQGHRMSNFHIQLDGALRAPLEYAQETIINGDELVPLISLASIAAKVIRDRRMVEFSKQYPLYGFEKHKGYGTAMHYEMLKKHGFCDIHRRSFIHLDFIHT